MRLPVEKLITINFTRLPGIVWVSERNWNLSYTHNTKRVLTSFLQVSGAHYWRKMRSQKTFSPPKRGEKILLNFLCARLTFVPPQKRIIFTLRCIKAPAMLSQMRHEGMPSYASSHAVNREPWLYGLKEISFTTAEIASYNCTRRSYLAKHLNCPLNCAEEARKYSLRLKKKSEPFGRKALIIGRL